MSLHPTVPAGFCAAFFKGTRPGIEGWQNRLGRYLDRGAYSHCELVFTNGLSASSSLLDGGVRMKRIGYTSVGNWDFLPLPEDKQDDALRWFNDHLGAKYDLMGNLRFATNFARDSADRWFCSESCMAALGFPEAFRYGPSGAAVAMEWHFRTKMIEVPNG